jgi:hypothetical protein
MNAHSTGLVVSSEPQINWPTKKRELTTQEFFTTDFEADIVALRYLR